MIRNYKDLKEYIKADLEASKAPKCAFMRFLRRLAGCEESVTFKYVKILRWAEYFYNTNHKILYNILKIKLSRMGLKYNLRMEVNTIGKGLRIVHLAGGGGCIINANAVGEFCTIQSGAIVGKVATDENRPIIGDRVLIGLGAKLYGKITIGNDVIVLANAVVTKSFPDNCIIGGVPAKIIKMRD